MASSFDDGNPEIPRGIVGRVERVLVVGAGIAGLAVANALAHAGVDCLVVEARGRVGGRLCTGDLAGSSVDLGGSWIHHPDGNPLREFARSVGVACPPGNPLGALQAFDCFTGRWLSPVELDASMAVETDGLIEALDALRTRLGPGASAADGIEAYLGATTLAGNELRRARQALTADVEADAAGAADQQSLRWLWTQAEYGGDYFGDLPEGGCLCGGCDGGRAGRTTGLASGTSGSLEKGVVLTSANGTTETGSHVVVTVPLGVLKSGRPRFTPPLPSARVEAVDRLGYGRYERWLSSSTRPSGVEPGGHTWCSSQPRRASQPHGCSTSTRSPTVHPRLPRVPLRHTSPGRSLGGSRWTPGDGHAGGSPRCSLSRAGGSRCDRLGG